ncbi:MAG: hypothetical protein B6D61_08990 [Bacteroidetes bacterium 4484_249]|nr:MAG: hypothetical protein B6D61_08990 [Bacteroidetes bacterium 4484_249]OYT12270.1 MAG: hypothetical protein B6I19_10055 [Bacteroidetes bacterium 4572_114]
MIAFSSNPTGEHQYYPIWNCDKDDRFTFRKDRNLVIERGTNNCGPPNKILYTSSERNKFDKLWYFFIAMIRV